MFFYTWLNYKAIHRNFFSSTDFHYSFLRGLYTLYGGCFAIRTELPRNLSGISIRFIFIRLAPARSGRLMAYKQFNIPSIDVPKSTPFLWEIRKLSLFIHPNVPASKINGPISGSHLFAPEKIRFLNCVLSRKFIA